MEEHFDVDIIVSIAFVPERPTSHVWIEGGKITIKKFFGLITKEEIIESGWYENFEKYRNDFDTTEYLEKNGYNVYKFSERVNNRVCHKPYVKVYLTHENTVTKVFDNNNDAMSWIDQVKAASGKTFEIA